MQTYLDSAVAAKDSTIHRKYGGIVEVGAVRYIADTVTVVACVVEVGVATDGVVTDSAEGVFHKQDHNHVTVTVVHGRMGIYELFGNGVRHTLVGEYLTGTDSVVPYGTEGVAYEETQCRGAVATVHALVRMDVFACSDVCAVLVSFHLTGTDSVVQGVVVCRMHGDFEHLSRSATGDDTCIAIASMACLGSAVEGSVGESCIASHRTGIRQIVATVEQTAARIVGSCSRCIYVARATGSTTRIG